MSIYVASVVVYTCSIYIIFILTAWCKGLTHWKIPWCWERLRAGGEEGDRGWDGWMASSTHWTWVWANSRRQWWTQKLGLLQSMGSQRVGHNWVTEQQQIVFIINLISVALRERHFKVLHVIHILLCVNRYLVGSCYTTQGPSLALLMTYRCGIGGWMWEGSSRGRGRIYSFDWFTLL